MSVEGQPLARVPDGPVQTALGLSAAFRTFFDGLRTFVNGVRYGNGSPEGVVIAGVGTLYRRLDGGANTTLYVKESGTGNTGWIAK